MKTFKTSAVTTLLTLSCVLLSGCLKTRAQLRGEMPDESIPVAVQPAQDVAPQGRYILDEIKAEITKMEGRLEDLERNYREVTQFSHDIHPDQIRKINDRMDGLEQALSDAMKKSVQSAPTPPVNPADLFKKAKSQFDAKDYEEAVKSLSLYSKLDHPKLLEQATFMSGESYYQLKDFKKAVVEFSKFPEKFKKSTHMPEALYKIALSFEEMDMDDDAQGFFEELTHKFPKSNQAKKAKAKLKKERR